MIQNMKNGKIEKTAFLGKLTISFKQSYLKSSGKKTIFHFYLLIIQKKPQNKKMAILGLKIAIFGYFPTNIQWPLIEL